jgi:hypothetical protein
MRDTPAVTALRLLSGAISVQPTLAEKMALVKSESERINAIVSDVWTLARRMKPLQSLTASSPW